MRVIAGRFKGRRLAPAPPGVRPTSDRVRERLFAVLEPALAGVRVLDLCCGTGALGIEALSRGAAAALFVDRSAPSLAVLERNLAPLRAAAPELAMAVRRAEAVDFVRRQWPSPAPGLVFLDPPYGEPLGPALLAALAERRPARVVYESEDRDVDAPAGLVIERVLRFGDTRVTLLRGGEAP
ncbi:MAG: RsmD family RNA methyltransferase [Candidatus Krumholzibacteriia bacterium]|nr:RsmD family RNA methyltransferase [Candidatus Latescibacterota bacterium]